MERFRETFACRGDDGDELQITQGFDGKEFYTEVGGRRVAIRRDGAWVSLDPDWEVETSPDYEQTIVSYRGMPPKIGKPS
jgi:hypothetical protein